MSEYELDACKDELPPLPGDLVEAVDELFEELDGLRQLKSGSQGGAYATEVERLREALIALLRTSYP